MNLFRLKKIGGKMNYIYFVLLSLFSFSVLWAQESGFSNDVERSFSRGNGVNYPSTTWNKIIGQSKVDIISSSTRASTINNFICDAILERTETDFAFVNLGDVSVNLFQGEITELDIVALCPYKRTLVILNVDGAFLQDLVESRISGFRPGLAIGGGKVEFDIDRPSKSRLTYFKVGDHPVYPKKDYRLVTTDYLVEGNAGFETLTHLDSTKVIYTEILLRDAVGDYIKRHTPLGPNNVRLDERWIKK
jgi:5'-nucleotidase